MFVFGDRVICDAADLIRAARCEFALLRSLDAELGNIDSDPQPDDRNHMRTAEPNTTWFADTWIAFVERFGDKAVQVRTPGIGRGQLVRPEGPSQHEAGDLVARLRDAHARTAAALHSGAPVIGGAVFFDGRFATHAAFLVRAKHRIRYRVHDLAAEDQPSIAAAVQAAACARAMEYAGTPADPQVSLQLGARSTTFALAELLPVFQARRARLEHLVDDKLNELLPVQWGDPRYLACGHCSTCRAAAETARDLLLVAGMDSTTRARLREAGITTIDRLAAGEGPVHGTSPRLVHHLREQAGIQLSARQRGRAGHVVTDARPLAALPTSSPGDLSLAVEYLVPGRVQITVGSRGAVALRRDVALDPVRDGCAVAPVRAQQRAALDELLGFVATRRRTHPWLHIFHYTSDARSLLLYACARLGVGEETVDELLHDGVLVDLYPIVRSALLIGQGSYQLEQVAALLSEPSHPEPEPACTTVLQLRDLLLNHAAAHGIDPRAPDRQATSGPQLRPTSVEAALAEYAESAAQTAQLTPGAALPRDNAAPADTPAADLRNYTAVPAAPNTSSGSHECERSDSASERSDEVPDPRRIAAVVAAASAYYRRERQLLLLSHIDRLRQPVHDWPLSPGVMVAEHSAVDTRWQLGPRNELMRRFLTLTGRIGTGASLAPGAHVHLYYDRLADGPAAGDRAVTSATVLGCSVDADFADLVRVEELLPAGATPYDDLPVALAPGPPDHDSSVETAVDRTAGELLMTLPNLPRHAIFDVLAGRAPRLRNRNELTPVHGDHAAAISTTVAALAGSYLAVQGPPGTGKTATIARVIERAVSRDGWRVGVVATTAAAVENLLDAVVRAEVLPELVGKKDSAAVAPEWQVIDAARYQRFLDSAINGCVLGGDVGDFADERLVPRDALDLLVIADAGRFGLADTIAVAMSARNLVIVGDPMPDTAPQPAPITFAPTCHPHPEPVRESVLGWLTTGRTTLPSSRGYFLDRTWRLHPRVNTPISRCYYDNRLLASQTVALARHLADIDPGIETALVEHHGNSTESDAEAREVVRRVKALLGSAWRVGATTRRLHPHDILVVTPYRAQVARIRTLLARAKIEDVLVGTPELFRGREAAVVLLSMASSSPDDAPFGVRFLLSRSVVRGALARAMWKAVIIRSPLLTEYLPNTRKDLADLAQFLRLS